MTERVCVTPGAPAGFEVYGTPRTVDGVRVIEVHSRYYLSPCMRWEANKHLVSEGGCGGWIVASEDGREYTNPFARRADALRVMAELAGGA